MEREKNDGKKIEYDNIVALEPTYVEGMGDCTEVHMNDGEKVLVLKNAKLCMDKMAEYYCTNLKANRKVYGRMLSIKNKVPYVFSDKHVMVHYKARVPRFKSDGASGWFDVDYFEEFVREDKTQYVLLKNGDKLKLEQAAATCKKYINYGELLKFKKR